MRWQKFRQKKRAGYLLYLLCLSYNQLTLSGTEYYMALSLLVVLSIYAIKYEQNLKQSTKHLSLFSEDPYSIRKLIDMTVLNSTALPSERTDAQSPPVLYNYLITAHRVKHSSNMAPASTDYVVCIICWSQTKIRSVTRELSCKFSSLYEFRSCDVSSNQLWGYVNVVSCCCSLSVCFYCLRRQTQRL